MRPSKQRRIPTVMHFIDYRFKVLHRALWLFHDRAQSAG